MKIMGCSIRAWITKDPRYASDIVLAANCGVTVCWSLCSEAYIFIDILSVLIIWGLPDALVASIGFPDEEPRTEDSIQNAFWNLFYLMHDFDCLRRQRRRSFTSPAIALVL